MKELGELYELTYAFRNLPNTEENRRAWWDGAKIIFGGVLVEFPKEQNDNEKPPGNGGSFRALVSPKYQPRSVFVIESGQEKARFAVTVQVRHLDYWYGEEAGKA